MFVTEYWTENKTFFLLVFQFDSGENVDWNKYTSSDLVQKKEQNRVPIKLENTVALM